VEDRCETPNGDPGGVPAEGFVTADTTGATAVVTADTTGATAVVTAATTGATAVVTADTTGATAVVTAATTGATAVVTADTAGATAVVTADTTGATAVVTAATTGATAVVTADTTGATAVASVKPSKVADFVAVETTGAAALADTESTAVTVEIGDSAGETSEVGESLDEPGEDVGPADEPAASVTSDVAVVAAPATDATAAEATLDVALLVAGVLGAADRAGAGVVSGEDAAELAGTLVAAVAAVLVAADTAEAFVADEEEVASVADGAEEAAFVADGAQEAAFVTDGAQEAAFVTDGEVVALVADEGVASFVADEGQEAVFVAQEAVFVAEEAPELALDSTAETALLAVDVAEPSVDERGAADDTPRRRRRRKSTAPAMRPARMDQRTTVRPTKLAIPRSRPGNRTSRKKSKRRDFRQRPPTSHRPRPDVTGRRREVTQREELLVSRLDPRATSAGQPPPHCSRERTHAGEHPPQHRWHVDDLDRPPEGTNDGIGHRRRGGGEGSRLHASGHPSDDESGANHGEADARIDQRVAQAAGEGVKARLRRAVDEVGSSGPVAGHRREHHDAPVALTSHPIGHGHERGGETREVGGDQRGSPLWVVFERFLVTELPG
jgi:hypothetical protein